MVNYLVRDKIPCAICGGQATVNCATSKGLIPSCQKDVGKVQHNLAKLVKAGVINGYTFYKLQNDIFVVNLYDRANGQVVCWSAFATEQEANDYADYSDNFHAEISTVPKDEFHFKVSTFKLVICPTCKRKVQEGNVYQDGTCVECGRPSLKEGN